MSDEPSFSTAESDVASGVGSDAESKVSDAGLTWYVYDERANLLRIAQSLDEAEAWVAKCWGVDTVAEREQVNGPDFWYPAMPGTGSSVYAAIEYRARIVRLDRVWAVGRDAAAAPRYL